jgi:predicted ferric reductase
MQIVLFLVLVLLVLMVIVSKKDTMTKSAQITIFVVVAIFALSIYFYESSQKNSAEYNREVVNAYRQGKTLQCEEYTVDKNRFLYVSGTQTFVPKDDIVTLEGIIIKVSTCKVSN